MSEDKPKKTYEELENENIELKKQSKSVKKVSDKNELEIKDKKTKSNEKRYIIFAIIGSIVILSILAGVRFGNFEEPIERPFGVGQIGLEHAHAKFAVLLNGTWISFDAVSFDRYANANNYIFMNPDGTYNIIHRVASGATLGMFFDSLGFTYTGNCFILPESATDTNFNPPPQTEYCNEGEMKLKLYVNRDLNEENENYVIHELDNILIAWDDTNKPTRNYS